MLILVLVATVLPASTVAKQMEEGNPIRKVVDMLHDMQNELEHEAETEKDVFEKAECMCKAGKKELTGVINVADSDIAMYSSKVESETAQKQKLAADLVAHKADLEDNENSLATQTALREKDNAAFAATEADCKTNIAQLGAAIKLFDEGAGGASFLQSGKGSDLAAAIKSMVMNGKLLDSDRRQTMLGFLEQGEDATEPTAPVAELVGIMKDMHDQISADLAEATKTEQTDAEAFFNMKKTKQKHIHTTGETIIDKTKRHGALALSLSQSKDALDDAQTEKDDGTQYLAALTEQCATKEADRVRRNQMRNDELSAISQAIQILSEDDALDTFKKALPRGGAFLSKPRRTYRASLLQKSSPAVVKKHGSAKKTNVMLLSLRSASKRPTEVKSATEFGSGASKVVHFMIDNMVEQLHNDDVDDEHKKEFCYNETESFTQLQADKEALDDQLNTTIDKLTGDLSELSADIKVLEESIYNTDQDTLKATAVRESEHKDFVGSFRAMETAMRLIDRAASKLQDVYSPKMMKGKRDAVTGAALDKAGLSLAQRRVAPIVISDTPDVYEHQESGGVIGLMDKLKEEIAADMKEAQLEEGHSNKDYTKVMHEAKVSRGNDAQSLHVKSAQHAELSEQKHNAEELQALTKQEVLNIIAYLRQLDIECTFLMKNFEPRHDSRVGEEGGLEKAETIVTGKEPPAHHEIEEVYDEEHAHQEVDEHFPDIPMKEVMGN